MIECWRLDSPATSLVLVSHNGQLPEVLHFGARLADGENLVALYRASISDVTGGMIDARPHMSVCPLAEDTFPGAQGSDAVFSPRFLEAEEGDAALVLTFADGSTTYRLEVELDAETDVWTMIAHLSGVDASWLTAPAFPVPSDSDHFVTYGGKWIGEFKENRVDWVTGAHVREVRDGRTSHEAFPGVLIPCDDGFIAGHLGMRCGHRFVAEQLPDGRRQIQFGPMLGRVENEITAGPLYLTRAENRNGVTANLHAHFRKHIATFADPSRPRPVHYNCWEAVYFDHDEVLLHDIATRAADAINQGTRKLWAGLPCTERHGHPVTALLLHQAAECKANQSCNLGS